MRHIILHGKRFPVVDVVCALNIIGISDTEIKETSTDRDILMQINKMSAEQDLKFWELLS